ncbi:hypothetical protein SteCoe_28620 [Stentor coeruleus]|uniref:Major facilitator superfamily (MFS) profile domain-containing protein n=1 Tax=Stentor coeruleus TaxID=5963 RepID=A0A1R2B7V5_9CILI|nr:hypothetical protein SteCoe_28620 [Stentor coeruleus]
MNPYIASYYHHKDNSVENADFLIVVSIMDFADCIFSVLAGYLIRIFEPFWVASVGTFLSLIIVFCSSYIGNPILFCWVFGLSIGLLSANIFFPVIWIVWNQIPSNKATSNGLLLAGLNLGPAFFGIIFTMIVNPHNYEAKTIQSNGKEDQKIFDKDVSDRVPMTIRWIVVISFLCSFLGFALIKRKWKSENIEDDATKSTMTFKDMLKNWKAWNLFFILFFGLSSMTYIFNTYKIIGMNNINDDHFVSFIGSLASVLSCFGRIFFGYILNKYLWKRVMAISYILEAAFFITFGLMFDNELFYSLYVIIMFFLSMPCFNGIMIQTDKNFPRDKWILTYVSLSCIPAFALPYIFEKFLTPEIGYGWTLCVLGTFQLIAAFQTIFHDVEAMKVENEKLIEDSEEVLK